MKQLLILLLLIITSHSLYAQDVFQKEQSIGLTIAYNGGYFKDTNFSPLNYGMQGIHGSLQYQRSMKSSKMYTSLSFDYNLLPTQAADFFTATQMEAHLYYSYLFKLYQKDAFRWYLGPSFRSENIFVLFEGLNSFTFLFAHSLGVDVELNYQLGADAQFGFQLGVPLIHLFVRPPYNGFDKITELNAENPLKLITYGNAASWNRYISTYSSISYQRSLNKRFNLALLYLLNIHKSFEIHDLIILQNRFGASIHYTF